MSKTESQTTAWQRLIDFFNGWNAWSDVLPRSSRKVEFETSDGGRMIGHASRFSDDGEIIDDQGRPWRVTITRWRYL